MTQIIGGLGRSSEAEDDNVGGGEWRGKDDEPFACACQDDDEDDDVDESPRPGCAHATRITTRIWALRFNVVMVCVLIGGCLKATMVKQVR